MFSLLPKYCSIIISLSLLSACGGGGSESNSAPIVVAPVIPSYIISGSGIKGPLANADVKLYKFDSAATGGMGSLVVQGTTNSKAQISGLSVSGELDGFYVLEFTATDSTIDVSTSVQPIISRFRTIVSSEQVLSEQPIYASPLSTLTIERARQKVIEGMAISDALLDAENEVKSFFGLGISKDTSVLSSAAMLTENDASLDQQVSAFRLRKAIEAFSILVSNLHEKINDSTLTKDQLIDRIAADISDGSLDALDTKGTVFSYTAEQLNVFLQTVNLIEIPNTDGKMLSQLAQIMADETSYTFDHMQDTSEFITQAVSNSNFFSNKSDFDGDGVKNFEDEDDDNDSVLDSDDDLPFNGAEYVDTDLDGVGNNQDADDDDDGVSDSEDLFPLDSSESADFDLDGIGNNADLDDDNDSVSDVDDAFPFDNTESIDTDVDGIGNNADKDDDNDSFDDIVDAFPLDEYEWLDTDLDGIGNNTDSDDDNDGVYDNDDELPLDSTETVDFDKDGIGDIADNDDDNDSTVDSNDNIHVSVLDSYSVSVEQELNFSIRGFYNNGTRLLAENGWHVQYYITDLAKGKRVAFYIDNNYYNARFSTSKKEWLFSFPAPSYSGNFQLEVTVYCSKGAGDCSPNTDGSKYYSWKQNVDFTVLCEQSPCGYQPAQEPGKNISSSANMNRPVASVLRSDGDVILAYIDYEENNWKTHIVRSTNKGYSWSKLSRLPDAISSGEMIEQTGSKKLLIVGRCSADVCMYESNDAKSWSKITLTRSTNFANCFGGCDINYMSIRKVLEADDGAIMVYYRIQEEGKEVSYFTKSYDKVTWSKPIVIFSGEHHNLLDVVMLENGQYVALMNSFDDYKTYFMTSSDGYKWENKQAFVKKTSSPAKAELFPLGVGVRVVYTDFDAIYELNSTNLVDYSAPLKIIENIGLSFEAVPYTWTEFGIMYDLDLNFQTDVFYETVELDN